MSYAASLVCLNCSVQHSDVSGIDFISLAAALKLHTSIPDISDILRPGNFTLKSA